MSQTISLPTTLTPHLTALETAGLIRRLALEPELEYLFRHALTQEATYASLLKSDRRTLHRLVGEVLEASLPHERYGILAHHFQRAEMNDKARAYFIEAAEHASARYANEDAIQYYTQAESLTSPDDLRGQYEVLAARERLYGVRGLRPEQQNSLSQLQALAEQLNDDLCQIEVTLRQARYAEVTGDYAAGLRLAESGVTRARASGLLGQEAEGHFRWGRLLALSADHSAASGQYVTALTLARQARLINIETDALRGLGDLATNESRYAEARVFQEQALQLDRQAGHLRGECSTLNNLGNILKNMGDYAAANGYYEQSLRLCQQLGYRMAEGIVLNNLGNVAKQQGQAHAAHAHYLRALELSREIANPYGEALALGNLGLVVAEQGNYPSARIYQTQALRLCRQLGDRQGEGRALANLGQTACLLGDDEQAETCFEQALPLIRAALDRWLESNALAYWATLCCWRGRYALARDHAEQAWRIAHEIQAGEEEPQALTVWGHSLAGLKRWEEAAEKYARAMTLYQKLQSRRYLEPLAGLIELDLLQGHLAEAHVKAQAVLVDLSPSAPTGLDDLPGIYWACYRVLEALQDARASQVLAWGYQLIEIRAAWIEAEAQRRSFWENVPSHRAIREAWRITVHG